MLNQIFRYLLGLNARFGFLISPFEVIKIQTSDGKYFKNGAREGYNFEVEYFRFRYADSKAVNVFRACNVLFQERPYTHKICFAITKKRYFDSLPDLKE